MGRNRRCGRRGDARGGGGGNIDEIALARAVARVDVGIGEWNGNSWVDLNIPFEITEVYVMRPAGTFSVIPVASSFAAEEPSIPDGASYLSAAESVDSFKYTDVEPGGKLLTRSIYIPEAVVVGKEFWDQTAIVVGGTYRGGKVTYYRANFKTKDGVTTDVVRNHLYRFSVTSVLAEGHDDPVEAYEYVGESNMTATVVAWNEESFPDLTFVGDVYFGLDESEVETGAWANETKTVTMRTNLFNFTMSLEGGSAVLSAAGVKAAGEDGQVVESDHFGYTLKRSTTDSEEWTLEIAPLANNIAVSGAAHLDEWTIDAPYDTVGNSIVSTLSVSQAFLAGRTTPPSEVTIPYNTDGTGGAIWATTNLLDDGIFALDPTDDGGLFQWGRNVAWAHPGNGVIISTWPTSGLGSEVATWPEETDPCPADWRLPTLKEWQRFESVMSKPVTSGDRTFTSANGNITLPAAGYINAGTGDGLGTLANYWSGAQGSATTHAYSFNWALTATAGVVDANKNYGNSVRCVQDLPYAFSPAGEFQVGDLIWAGSNVNAPGTFAANNYDLGRLYQFGSALMPESARYIGWTNTSNPNSLQALGATAGIDADGNPVAFSGHWTPDYWNPGTAEGWTYDPCPKNWRTPTWAEWQSLIDGTNSASNRALQTVGGVSGREFTISAGVDADKKLFLPVMGYRVNGTGTVSSIQDAYYWSSTPDGTSAYYGYRFFFGNSSYAQQSSIFTYYALPVRCVRTL